MIWTPVLSMRISSRILVPPIQAWTETFRYWPMSLTTSAIWVANSRVGETISAWHFSFSWSIIWSDEIVNVAVFPVPLCACAMVSCPYNTGSIPFCWMGDGFVNPYPYIPRSKSSFKSRLSNFWTDLSQFDSISAFSSFFSSSLSSSLGVSIFVVSL